MVDDGKRVGHVTKSLVSVREFDSQRITEVGVGFIRATSCGEFGCFNVLSFKWSSHHDLGNVHDLDRRFFAANQAL